MRKTIGIAVLAGALALQLGCRAEFATLDEACPDDVGGSNYLEPGHETALVRIACYRRFVQLSPARATRGIQQAVSAHADYLETNGLLAPGRIDTLDPFAENPTLIGFTGQEVFARLAAAEAIDDTASIGVWDVFLGQVDPLARARTIDELFAIPWLRDALFQPALIGVGYDEADGGDATYGYMNVVYTFPPNLRIDRPIVFPKDGQIDVPTSYTPINSPLNPINVGRVIGTPISISVGSYEGNRFADNPYGLSLLEATLLGPDGEPVALVSGGPGRYPWGDTQATVVIAPTQPLLPESTYELQATLSWNARTNKRVTTVFTTGGLPTSAP